MNEEGRWNKVLQKAFPWGMLFATRKNYESGYFVEEERLVRKYLQASSDILVLGSGNGREARPICNDGHTIVCVDISHTYLQSGKGLFRNEKVQGIRFAQGDVLAGLAFTESSFDFVFFSLYSPAGERRFDVTRDIRRVMKPDGTLMLCSCTPLYGRLYPPKITDGWALIDGTEQLAEETSACGFAVIESATDQIRPEYRFSILRAADQATPFPES